MNFLIHTKEHTYLQEFQIQTRLLCVDTKFFKELSSEYQNLSGLKAKYLEQKSWKKHALLTKKLQHFRVSSSKQLTCRRNTNEKGQH